MIVENISIAYDISQPNIEIISHTNPTSFTLHRNFRRPTLYLTSTLLNIADKSELEAIISHEIAHINSGFISDYRIIYNLLTLLRTFGFIFFLLLVSLLDLNFLILWIFLIFSVCLEEIVKKSN